MLKLDVLPEEEEFDGWRAVQVIKKASRGYDRGRLTSTEELSLIAGVLLFGLVVVAFIVVKLIS